MKKTIIAITTVLCTFLLAPSVVNAEANASVEGLTLIDRGAAAYYSPNFEGAGWERIRRIQARNYGLDPTEVDDADNFFCVRIGYLPGNILTLRNPTTGVTARCMVADVNAPQDNAVWRSRWVVECSFGLFRYLGLNDTNRVEVYVMTNG